MIQSLSFLDGGGEMGSLIRGNQWAKTPLGIPQGWPQSLRTVVRLVLNARRPAFIFWGPDSLCLYNDAYRALSLDEKHSNRLGQPASQVLEDLWPALRPQIEKVLQTGKATYFYNQPLPITTHSDGQIYWTYSFTPIDEDGAPKATGGVLVTTSDTTAQVLDQQRGLLEAKRQRSLLQKMPPKFDTCAT